MDKPGKGHWRYYRHPKHDAVAAFLRLRNVSDVEAARVFDLARKTVGRIRTIEGIPAFTTSRTVAEILAQDSEKRDDGHTYWNGCRDKSGVPQIRSGGKYLRATHVAFEMHHQRPPIGYVKADCDVPYCLTPSHLLDEIGRRNLYMQMRALQGLYGHWNTCSKCGADWETHGRVQPTLQIYCNACGTRRMRNLREVKDQ